MPDSDLRQYTNSFRASQSRIKRKRVVVSCSSCRRRKAKCDRKQPCSSCETRGEGDFCDFRSSSSHRRLELDKELNHIENAVQKLVDSNQVVDLRQVSSSYLTMNKGVSAKPKSITPHDSQITESWVDLIESIRDIRSKLDGPANGIAPEVALESEPDLVFGSAAPITIKEAIKALPARQASDRIISAYFNAKYVAVPFIHPHQFRRQYEQFWENPERCDVLWISILFSILSIGSTVVSSKGLLPPYAKDSFDSKAYISLSARCLVAGRYLTAEEFSVEALLLHAHSRYTNGRDNATLLPSLCGLIVRLAQARGYHRELGNLPTDNTPFSMEMRRRVWFMIQYYDLLFALEHDIPPLIHEDTFDTEHPTHLSDDDFDEDSICLSPRPITDPQPILACIYQSKLLPILRRVIRHTYAPKVSADSSIFTLSTELDQWYASIPPCLKVRSVRNTSFTDQNHTVMNRVMLELMYNMSISVLYRPFLQPSPDQALLYDSSLDICRKIALKSVNMYVEIHQEMTMGGRLHEDRYISPSLRLHDCVIATMVLPLAFVGCPNLPRNEGSYIVRTFRKAFEIWSGRDTTSTFVSSAFNAFKKLLDQIEAIEKSYNLDQRSTISRASGAHNGNSLGNDSGHPSCQSYDFQFQSYSDKAAPPDVPGDFVESVAWSEAHLLTAVQHQNALDPCIHNDSVDSSIVRQVFSDVAL